MTTPIPATVKPKERQFQVVPVPAVFKRGRWECSDFKDAPENQILEFTSNEKHSAAPPNTVLPTTINEGPSTSCPPSGAAISQQHHAQQQQIHSSSSTANLDQTAIPSGHTLPVTVDQIDAYTNHNNVAHTHNNFSNESSTSAGSSGILVNGCSSSSLLSGANSVAIDNKIEQAMDLVKTHLTFAVREEVEILRSTISDLESKVGLLENENRILRQFVPPEVLQNMPILLHNAQQSKS